jgi:hypothetical protein
MMASDFMTLLAASVGAALAAGIVYAAIRYFRYLVRVRCAHLEEALRIYSNASAAVGRHVTALEIELQEMRQRLAAMEGAGLREHLREPAAAQARQQDVSVAEQRLSRLIRSRLGELRSG